MTRHSKTTFTFDPQFRTRLRQLRKRRGLTLRAMAVLMDGPGSGAHVQLARSEHGKVNYPSFNLIADNLRECAREAARVRDELASRRQLTVSDKPATKPHRLRIRKPRAASTSTFASTSACAA
jgi:transcriptional regulator with XRE-family HTH domain